MPFMLTVQLNFNRFRKISYEIYGAIKWVRFGHIVVQSRRNAIQRSQYTIVMNFRLEFTAKPACNELKNLCDTQKKL